MFDSTKTYTAYRVGPSSNAATTLGTATPPAPAPAPAAAVSKLGSPPAAAAAAPIARQPLVNPAAIIAARENEAFIIHQMLDWEAGRYEARVQRPQVTAAARAAAAAARGAAAATAKEAPT